MLFAFLTMHFLKVYEKPTNALLIQCIGTPYSPTRFSTLKCQHQGVEHVMGSREGWELYIATGGVMVSILMGAVYCNRWCDGQDIDGSCILQYTAPILLCFP
jgi:hypothetical protein